MLAGRPIWEPTAFQRAPSRRARSLPVATHTVPSRVSANTHGVPGGSPSAALNTCQWPPLKSATPPNVKPTHKPPPRGAKCREIRTQRRELRVVGQLDTLEPDSVESKQSARARHPQIAVVRLCECDDAAQRCALARAPGHVWCSSLMARSGLSAAAQPHQSSAAIASHPSFRRMTGLSFTAVVANYVRRKSQRVGLIVDLTVGAGKSEAGTNPRSRVPASGLPAVPRHPTPHHHGTVRPR